MRWTMVIVVVVVVALSLAGACGSDEPRWEDELVLRGYPAQGQAETLADAIGSLLRLGEERIGSARVGPGDQVLVLAPRSVHEGIAEAVEAQSGAAPVTRYSVAMTYWFVAARPAAEQPPPEDSLREIEPVLGEIAGVQGPHEFRLIERLQLRQASGHYRPSEASSPKVSITQQASVSDGGVVGWVQAELLGPNKIHTAISVRPGQFLVLGQLALEANIDPFRSGGPLDGRESVAVRTRPSETSLYLIVRAEIDPPL